jgi:histidine triad (HIT) family protein
MYNNAPLGYKCPICLAIRGIENEDTWIKQADIFYRDDAVLGFISSKFIEGNEGHPLLVPIEHRENIFDLPPETGARISQLATKTALALKELRRCDGITILQNNEPAGDQHAFHYHLHVCPRFVGDSFHENLMRGRVSRPEKRTAYAEELRSYFGRQSSKQDTL